MAGTQNDHELLRLQEPMLQKFVVVLGSGTQAYAGTQNDHELLKHRILETKKFVVVLGSGHVCGGVAGATLLSESSQAKERKIPNESSHVKDSHSVAVCCYPVTQYSINKYPQTQHSVKTSSFS